MITQNVSVSFYLEKTKPNSENKCLIKMVVYCNPNKKRYSTNCHVTELEWEKLKNANLRDKSLKDIKQVLNQMELKATKAIEKLNPFSFLAFEEIYFGTQKAAAQTSLQYWFKNYIAELYSQERIGTAMSYNTTLNSLNLFKKGLHIQDVTPALLTSYEKFMIAQGKSYTTLGIYLRQLRTIINQTIDAGILSADKYPFKKYDIPTSRNIKKALSEADVKRILDFQTDDEELRKAADFWLLSYLCSGINFADIIQLKPANINGNYLFFIRQKTKLTKKKDLRPIKVGLHPRAIEIIEKYRNKEANAEFLFPILDNTIGAKTVKYRCQNFIKWVNKRMEKVASELGIEQKVGTYAARHTFSTILKRKGVSTEFIKESLGHSSVAITENYLDSFADDTKLEMTNLLTDF